MEIYMARNICISAYANAYFARTYLQHTSGLNVEQLHPNSIRVL